MKNTENKEEVIRISRERSKDYYRKFDPYFGDPKQEVIPRQRIVINDNPYYLPQDMFDNEPILQELKRKTVKQLLKEMGDDPSDENAQAVELELMKVRLFYDYEYFAAVCITIGDKRSKKDIPLILNKGQRILTQAFESQRRNHQPIRVILDKARQWGGSTDTEGYMFWLQTYHYQNWHSAIITKVNSQAVNIRAMITKMVNNFPSEIMGLSIKAFEGMQNTKIIPERGCRITVASAESPENLRSFDFAMLHMSEVATWPDTPAKSGDDLAQSLNSTVPYEEGTMIVMESTAKGVGGYFHDEWLAACDKDNHSEGKKIPVFVPWFMIDMYRTPVRDYSKFIDTMTDYNWWQFKQGATLEGINWYNNYKKANRYSDFQMKSEFPTTADESFQSKAGKYFSDFMIDSLRRTCSQPLFIGDIKGDAVIGEESLNNIYLESNDSLIDGSLKIWIYPDKDKDRVIKHRFVVVVDIGGLSYKSDNSVISVFDRKGLLDPHGYIERAAIWYGHIDHDILAWKAAQIATYYNDALLVIESNTIDSKDKKSGDIAYEGDHSYTVLNEIGDVYKNMYMRLSAPDKSKTTPTLKYGWHMNRKTKYQAYDMYKNAIRDDLYIEHCHEAVNEASTLLLSTRGQIEAMKGRRDDMQDTTAVGVYIAYDPKEMSLPKVIDNTHRRRKGGKNRGRSYGASSF